MTGAGQGKVAGLAVARRQFICPTLPGKRLELANIGSWLLSLRGLGRRLSLDNVRSVLVVRLDLIGDMVITTAFFRELRANLPKAWIALIVNPGIENLMETCPYINELFVYHQERSGILQRVCPPNNQAGSSLWRIWRRRFDLAILPRYDVENYNAPTLLAISGASWRMGYAENVTDIKQQRNRGQDRILTHALMGPELRHEAERCLDILRALGGNVRDTRLETWNDVSDSAAVDRILSPFLVNDSPPLIALAPDAGEKKRMWPVDRYASVGVWLTKKYGAKIVVIGSAEQAPLGRLLAAALGSNALNTMGALTLRQAGELLRRCCLYIGNDTGPMHLAASAGTPVVEISCHPKTGSPKHPNSPQRCGPWGVPSRILQPETPLPPCVDACEAPSPHCITTLSPAAVQAAVESFFPVWGSGRREKEFRVAQLIRPGFAG